VQVTGNLSVSSTLTAASTVEFTAATVVQHLPLAFSSTINTMDQASLNTALTWIIHHGYWLMLIAMLIEGPIITAAAAFAVALGYFDLTAVFLLSLAGDLLADVAYYGIGWVGRKQLAERWGHRVGLTTERMQHMEKLLEQHTVKTILILKLTPVLPTPGLILVGALRIPIRKFTLISLLITLPKTIF
jgi:membrane protein DedA with SNARE-associated domain